MSINKADIISKAKWRKMKLDELKSIDNFYCSDKMKDSIKTFLKEKIQKEYLFTNDIGVTEISYTGFEHFVAYKKEDDENGEIKTWFDYDDKYTFKLFEYDSS